MRICALVGDLMDRSRVTAARPEAEFVLDPSACGGAEVVVVDLARGADDTVARVRSAAPTARIVCFGPHVDTEAAVAARRAGADTVLPRSRFFRDPAAAIAGPAETA